MIATGTTLAPEIKASALALMTKHFRAARKFDGVLMREPERDDDGMLRGYSGEQTEILEELAQLLGIDPLDVSAPVVAEELGSAAADNHA